MFTVRVEGLEFYAYHGVPDAERQIGHRIRVDISVETGLLAGQSDRIEDTVDYVHLARDVEDLSRSRQFRTLEAFAMTAASLILRNHPAAQTVALRIAKPLPPAPIVAESVSVSFRLDRSQLSQDFAAE